MHIISSGEWFEFVWSTTRGLRKDITQQQLANPTAVAIVEKCARLHIVCAERLVEEDSHNFAGKLNDENLTKCLQTLKHMYEDLGLEGVDSPCEPEFRAYEILMNLGSISLGLPGVRFAKISLVIAYEVMIPYPMFVVNLK